MMSRRTLPHSRRRPEASMNESVTMRVLRQPRMDHGIPPMPEAAAKIGLIEAEAEILRTPSGAGDMIWRVWGRGSGRPNLVFFHGGYGSWIHWIRNVPFFREHFTVYAADSPGLGDSAPPPDVQNADKIGRVIADGLELMFPKLDDRFHVTGFSFGAILGGHAAQYLDQRLQSFTLVGAGGMGLTRAEGMPMGRFRRDMTHDEFKALARRNLEILMLRDPGEVDDVALLMQMMNTTRAVTKSRNISRDAGLARVLPLCPAPIAGIWGELDSTSYPFIHERQELLRRVQPDCPFLIIPGAGHWAMYERPDAFNQALLGVLRRCD
jgi:2-hydroxy-6-oxonona-2,4-dienedioate hydrolase